MLDLDDLRNVDVWNTSLLHTVLIVLMWTPARDHNVISQLCPAARFVCKSLGPKLLYTSRKLPDGYGRCVRFKNLLSRTSTRVRLWAPHGTMTFYSIIINRLRQDGYYGRLQ